MAAATTPTGAQLRGPAPTGLQRHQLGRLAAGIRCAARRSGVTLTPSYSERVAVDGLALCGRLGVTVLGEGVVIHTAPETNDQLPIFLGYADSNGEWLRDGSRHASTEVTG